MMDVMDTKDAFDVAIAGSGLGGSTLAMILARHGHSVLLLESGSHPRFAIGESVVPEFGARARLMAEAFRVPEIGYMGNFQMLRHHVSGNSGIKRNFTFMHHREGEAHRPDATCQFQTLTYPLGPDSHIYRPDLDHWLTAVAVRYGVSYRERAPVEEISLGEEAVRIRAGGVSYGARFLVDATGFRSVLAKTLGLRAEAEMATDSRTVFTHMVGVKGVGKLPRVPSPPDQGTLHHLFSGGWFWVIPFENNVHSVNPVCSVGLTLDRRVWPDNDLGAEEEFRSFVDRFPTVARQLEEARAVRGWIKTGRMQYRSGRVAGDRWCLLPHAAGFVDPLFSGGMTLTLLGLDEVARILLNALEEDRFEAARFGAVEESARENLAVIDRIVHGAYVAMRSPALFNAWYRVWAVGNYHGVLGMTRLHMNYLRWRRREFLDASVRPPYRRVLGMDHPRLRTLLDEAYALICAFERGERGEARTVDALFSLLAGKRWIPPQFHIADRSRNHLASFTVFPMLGIIRWGKRNAPDDMRQVYYDVGPIFLWELTKTLGREGWRSMSGFFRVLIDAHYSRGRS